MSKLNHEIVMTEALQLAERGRYTVSPNPMVGCIIVRDDTIVGRGYHQHAGEPHAEIYALREAGALAENATVYVTLEPCCHFGRTPPCVDALIAAKVKTVVVACLDPNPLVSGNGIKKLQAAGIEIIQGVMEKEAILLNEIFFHYIKTNTPFVIAKWAMSLDGKTITHTADDKNISGAASRVETHQLRQQVDAILIGANTAKQDNPLLTVRDLPDISKHPIRLVISSDGQLPSDLQLFSAELPGKTIVVATEKIKPLHQQQYNHLDIETIIIKQNAQGQVDLPLLMIELGKRGITSLLVEGGMEILQAFFAENLINKTIVYVAPIFIGKSIKKKSITQLTNKQVGDDFHLMGYNEDNQYV